VITDKWHGSSCIISKVLINRKLNLWQRFVNLIGGQIPTKKYGYIYSSGKPKSLLPKGIEGAWENTNKDYYISNIWKRAFDDCKHALEDGISIYSELVGFTENGGYIQSGYDYHCSSTEYKMVVYRITYTKPDGNVMEFSWQQIKDYCLKYRLEYVKELYHGKLIDWWNNRKFQDFSHDEWLKELSNEYLERDCKWNVNRVPAEGVVVRVDGRPKFYAYKIKSKRFTLEEDKQLETAVNIEEETAS